MGDCALHTVIGRNSRRRKGLEPSRRLSEMTGPQSPSAFRIAFLTAEVTNRRAPCKAAMPVSTHRAPALCRYRLAPDAGQTLPQTVEGLCTCYRSLAKAGVVPGIQGDRRSVDSFPRTHRTAVITLPLSIASSGAPHGTSPGAVRACNASNPAAGSDAGGLHGGAGTRAVRPAVGHAASNAQAARQVPRGGTRGLRAASWSAPLVRPRPAAS